jgi:cytochrome c-type biogenesis protein CcmH/NrfF
MFWFVVVAVVLVVSLVLRRVLRRRRSPVFDQRALENADYARVTQDLTNYDRHRGHYGG